MVTRSLVALSVIGLAVSSAAAQEPPPAPAASADSAAPRPPRSSSTLITYVEIERAGSSVASGLDVVQLLRPRWLRMRKEVLDLPGVTRTTTSEFSVFVNDHEMGGLSYLQSIPAEQIYTLRFLTMNEVGARYGPSSGPGIVVTMRR